MNIIAVTHAMIQRKGFCMYAIVKALVYDTISVCLWLAIS